MQYTNLGKTGMKVSRLCLGMMSYGSKSWRDWVLDEEQAKPFVRQRAFRRNLLPLLEKRPLFIKSIDAHQQITQPEACFDRRNLSHRQRAGRLKIPRYLKAYRFESAPFQIPAQQILHTRQRDSKCVRECLLWQLALPQQCGELPKARLQYCIVPQHQIMRQQPRLRIKNSLPVPFVVFG